MKKFIFILILGVAYMVYPQSNTFASRQIVSYPTPTATNGVLSMARGDDGNIWFTMPSENKLGKSTITGSIEEFDLSSSPSAIASGLDGNIWFTLGDAKKIAKISTQGQITEYDLSGQIGSRSTYGITAGSDGNIWVTAPSLDIGSSPGMILKVNTSGTAIDTYYTTISQQPGSIISGPEGNLWFTLWPSTNGVTNYLGRITTDGAQTRYPIPSYGDGTSVLTIGPDSNIWSIRINSASNPSLLRTITSLNGVEGDTVAFDLPSDSMAFYGITAGSDGNIWVALTAQGKLARYDSNGILVEELEMPSGLTPYSLIKGPDDRIWIGTSQGLAKIEDTQGSESSDPYDTQHSNTNNSTPAAPRTGKVVGVIIAISSLLAMIAVIANEARKSHGIKESSTK